MADAQTPDPIAVIVDEVMKAAIPVVTDAVTQAVVQQMAQYMDQRVDWVMNEVQQQILAFEEKVGAAFMQVTNDLTAKMVDLIVQDQTQDAMQERYREWVVGQAVTLGVSVPEFAKVLTAMKQTAPAPAPSNGAG